MEAAKPIDNMIGQFTCVCCRNIPSTIYKVPTANKEMNHWICTDCFDNTKDIKLTAGPMFGNISGVQHPEHYGGDTPFEVWKVLQAWGWRDFFKGNIVKYVARAGKKEGISEQEDLEKAKEYLDFLVQAEKEIE